MPHLPRPGPHLRPGSTPLARGTGGGALPVAGPNGGGKTSLRRMLAGLLAAYHGHVEHEGALALSDERPALDPHQPLGDALAFWREVDRAGESRADFGLEDLLDVPMRYLSTGQRKRAALARLAASAARIWLLDEPLNGLDTHWGASAQAANEAHRALGGIAVIASHQPLQLQKLRTLSLLEHLP